MLDAVEICKEVLARLSSMDFEKNGGSSKEQLIFPMKIQKKGTKQKDRVSELFVFPSANTRRSV